MPTTPGILSTLRDSALLAVHQTVLARRRLAPWPDPGGDRGDDPGRRLKES